MTKICSENERMETQFMTKKNEMKLEFDARSVNEALPGRRLLHL